ncbi:MAG: 6-phosphofructokinase [Planctomycetota bacterium]|jgi:6-phosphofructokinase 1
MKRIGVLTGGGDAPGLNAAIKSIVYRANDFGIETLGILDGWQGLLDGFSDDAMTLDYRRVRTWDRDGGTNLGSSRTNPMALKRGNERVDVTDEVLHNMERLGLDGLVAMGGEDTLGVANVLANKGAPVVGVPKTIDKDLLGTDYTIGFATAVENCQVIIDRCRNPAGSHHWIQVVEIMGRHTGHLSFWSGVAGSAFIILVPEVPFRFDHVERLLAARLERGAKDRRYPRYAFVVVSEGAAAEAGELTTVSDELDSFGHVKLGGVAEMMANWLRTETPFEARSVVPAHAQRGGPPGPVDRIMGTLFGSAAVDLLAQNKPGQMVSAKGVAPACRISYEPLEVVASGLNYLDVELYYDHERLNIDRGYFEGVLSGDL